MKHTPAYFMLIFAFLVAMSVHGNGVQAQENPEKIVTDQAIYPYWGKGGTVRVTATGLLSNRSYFLWLQKPQDTASKLVQTELRVLSNGTFSAPAIIGIGRGDPAGTYLVSLSTASQIDSAQAVVRFGIFGADKESYERTQTISIVGGGLAPNTAFSISVSSANESLPGFPVQLQSQGDGGFNYTFRLQESSPLGTTTILLRGLSYDSQAATTTSATVGVTPTTIIFRTLSAPPARIQRTTNVTVNFRFTYPDGTPVTRASAGNQLAVLNQTDVVTTLPLSLTDAQTGTWQAVWTPPLDAELGSYRLQFSDPLFDDSYGNTVRVSTYTSPEFRVDAANASPTYIAQAEYQRTESGDILVWARYPGGGNIQNVTSANAELREAGGDRYEVALTYNYIYCVSSNECARVFAVHVPIPANASLGPWSLAVEIRDVFGNSVSGQYVFLVVPAVFNFEVDFPSTAQRTTNIIVTALITYPDGTPIDHAINATISIGNTTWPLMFSYNSTTRLWSGAFFVRENATLGNYNLTIWGLDVYGNSGRFTGFSNVIPARLAIIILESETKAEPSEQLDVAVIVRYPNGTRLTDPSASVLAEYTDQGSPSGTRTVPLQYNSTDRMWHLGYTSPAVSPLSFGVTITFSFSASDEWGNSGSLDSAYQVKIGTEAQTLILAGVIGSLIPIGLLGWAIATISTRRRKHRP